MSGPTQTSQPPGATSSRSGKPGALTALAAWPVSLLLAIWAAVRLSGAESGFPFVALIAFTPYVAGAAVIVCLLLAVLGRRAAAAVAGVSALALLGAVVPRALPLERADIATASPRLRVLTANLAIGRVPASALVDLVRRHDVDVLSLQELTPEGAAELSRSGLGELLPYAHLRARPLAAGTGLMANRPLEAVAPPRAANAIAAAGARWPGIGHVGFVAVHPTAPTRSQLGRWKRDLRDLPPAGRPGTARILAGDFNATLDHAELRRLLSTGYRDVAANVGAGWNATWPSTGRLPGVAIDHVLIPEDWRALHAEVLALPGSDHRAVLAEIAPPERPQR